MTHPSHSPFSDIRCCVIIPTYNNHKTLSRVIEGVLMQTQGETKLIVVNDGSSSETTVILDQFQDAIDVVSYADNQGKGYALRMGFKRAIELGFENAITIDSDGQHFPSDIPHILEAGRAHPGVVVMGARNMEQSDVPGKSSFGNKFSNFWFKVETFISLPDTQTGFRMYPLGPISEMRLFTRKFEFEIELIVRLAWRGVKFVSVPVQVLYDENERVSHFRPFKDFARISILNTVLVAICLIYYYPKRLFSRRTAGLVLKNAFHPDESNFNRAKSIAFGLFMGVAPIWGFQLLVGIPLAVIFKMNKVLFIAAANISIPPFIPVILYLSMLTGQLVLGGEINHGRMMEMSFDAVKENIWTYIIGATIFAFILAIVSFVISLFALNIFRRGK